MTGVLDKVAAAAGEKPQADANAPEQRALARLTMIQQELRAAFLEREDEIDGLLTALLAQEHILILGPPGTAKSALVRAVCEAVDGSSYFQWLMTKFTMPEEVFGPISMKGFEQDLVQRIVTGKLPEANVAFLDEVFKANSAILNSLLTIANERRFHNGNGQPLDCPLWMLAGASNELPESDDLAALYDRFIFRFWTGRVVDRANLKTLIQRSKPSVSLKITMDQLHLLQSMVEQVSMPDEVIEAMLNIKAELEQAGIFCSDRRWVENSPNVVKAYVLLQGRMTATKDDLLILGHCLWREPDERPAVRDKVGSVASPLRSEAMAIADSAKDAFNALLALQADAEEFGNESVQCRANLKQMRKELEKKIEEAGAEANTDYARSVLRQLNSMSDEVRRRADKVLDG